MDAKKLLLIICCIFAFVIGLMLSDWLEIKIPNKVIYCLLTANGFLGGVLSERYLPKILCEWLNNITRRLERFNKGE